MKKNIVIFNKLKCAGAERMTLLYAKVLKENGFNVKMMFLSSWHDEQDMTFLKFMPTPMPYKILKLPKYIYDVYLFLYLYFVKPDFVFSSSAGMIVQLTKFKKYFKQMKVVGRLPNMPSTHKAPLNEICKKWYPNTDVLIAQTQEMKDEMLEYYQISKDKVIVINNPIDKGLIHEKIAETYAMDANYVNYVYVGQIIPRKDILTLLKAFKSVKEKQNNSRLYLLGKVLDNAYKQDLDVFISENNISDSVFFEGFQTNPFKYLNAGDVFVLSSIDEGLPNVMLEAMYLSKPVVCTRSVPFIEQTISEGVNGFSVAVGDYVHFAECMIKARDLTIRDRFVDVTNSEKLIISQFI